MITRETPLSFLERNTMTRLAGAWRRGCVPLVTALVGLAGCAHINEANQQHELARTQGKYHVVIASDVESVAGRCEFVRNIVADDEPTFRPTDADLPDYFRTEAAYIGADTVVVRGRTAEAYICGPGPLNPDGTRHTQDPNPH
jgi:hypothetical protein